MLYDTKWDAPYLPAAALGLTNKEHAALIRVLALLETAPETMNFNMGTYYHMGAHCGTPACIAGWANHLGRLGWFRNKKNGGVEGTERFSILAYNTRTGRLFHPPLDEDWGNIPPAAAARALRAYLTTGRPDWSPAPQPKGN